MTKPTILVLVCSLAACAVDPTELDDTEAEATEDEASARAVEAPFEVPPLLQQQQQFWCDKVLQESGTAYDNVRCRHRWWKQWHKTWPCSTYWIEYGPWVAGC